MYYIKVGKQSVRITHPDNILFPKSGITKNEFVEYYYRIASIMVPHMKDHPVTMKRFTGGIGEPGFFQKNIADYFPDWIARIPIKKKEGGVVNYVICNNAATLVYLANQLCITLHLWLSKIDKLNYPDKIIFDLDPSTKDFSQVIVTAKIIKNILEQQLDLKTYIMTTGSRGLHVVIPLKREYTFDFARKFAKDVARVMVYLHPKFLTLEIRKEKRGKKIFIDYLRNAYAQTGVSPYAVRAKEGAPIATPIDWNEVTSKLTPTKYTIKNIFRRLARKQDPWKDINKNACSLKKPRKILDSILKDLGIE